MSSANRISRTQMAIGLLFAAQATATPIDFIHEVRPIFEKHCYECHGETKRKGGLRLDVKAAAMILA
jgi:hypothetical protein